MAWVKISSWLDKHHQLVAKEHEKKTPHGPGTPPGIHSNAQNQFSMADMEALGFTIPVGQGPSQDLGLEINNQHQDNTDGFESDDEYNTMSDASDFRHALFDNTSWPEPIEVKARSSASLVLTALHLQWFLA
ncbi:hypothetical protein CROQUDRAFT_85341 [Cronartium quercuum f. sp. fusiforme G11]|uniref:Uncharacterized protein n=1 Tax=Cronartium quercuum f. sp. fusiforme G11 TaxID=708437 RepID=A0A9P6NRX2_9BASI|nr:hypothetical protein CROQUDRAFT_85341 [Cronartium quercuum f. sp. fusiforme G11]